MYDYIILGAGPAGIQVAYNLEKNNANYLILEAGSNAGTTFELYPRHRSLISINKRYTGSDNPEYNLRHDWNSLLSEERFPMFGSYDRQFFPHADNMVDYLKDFAKEHQLKISYNQKVVLIERQGEGFSLRSKSGELFECRRLIIAIGVGKPYIPDIPGIELVDQYENVSTHCAHFENKRVLVIGKGNSAFETADHLISSASLIHVCSPNPLNMAWKSHYVGDLRAVNNNLLDTYQLKSQNAVLDADIKSIRQSGGGFKVDFGYAHANGENESLYYDKIICCTGFRMDNSAFSPKILPKMVEKERFPQLTESFESVNVKNMFFAGTLTQSINYRKTTSGFIHGFRYNSMALVDILLEKFANKPLSFTKLNNTADDIAQAILNRINETSALWQQHGFMVDSIVVDQSQSASHYQQLPRQYVHKAFADQSLYFMLTLDFGAPIEGDPFNQVRVHKDDVTKAEHSKFLHPIIFLCSRSKEIAVHHIIEDLEADWTDNEVHFEPLRDFIAAHLDKLTTE